MTPITRRPSNNEEPSAWPEYSNTMVTQARKRAEMKRYRSKLSTDSFGPIKRSTQAIMKENILSSVKRTRARRDRLHLNKNSKQWLT